MCTENADHWYHNLDKLIHYVNLNASKGGPIRAFYSTPSHYTGKCKSNLQGPVLVVYGPVPREIACGYRRKERHEQAR